jgi:thioredoxin-dependent peroxiredoxin
MSFLTKTLRVGDKAPDFTLPSQSGQPVRLSALTAERVVVLYFYPADDTPGCTKESCSFRDHYDVFKDAGAEVIGVSKDSVASHTAFASKYRLPFTLLSDADGAVHAQYGARTLGGLMPRRVTFVIDRQNTIQHVFNAMFQAEQHVTDALGVIQSLTA